ncbi:MAG: DsrE family protein [Candidatus Rokubacteria bacterium]|nr:DsrE family protein [Candidatus Rokubacteria bacterium]
MPSLLCLVVDRAPYGSIEPAEAVRHAGGALGKGWDVTLGFMGDAVYTVLTGQAPASGEWVSLSAAVTDLIDRGGDRARVLAEQESLAVRDLSIDDLVPGVRAVARDEIARAMAACDRTLLF